MSSPTIVKTSADFLGIRGQHIAPTFLNTRLPRYQILGGARSKPLMIEQALGLTNVVREDAKDGKEVGRVRIITGDYNYEIEGRKGTLRIAGGETLMGMSACDMTQREFAAAAQGVEEGKNVCQIRSGTSGGNNTMTLEPPVMGLGDIVISDQNIGSCGAIEQALGYFRQILPARAGTDDLKKFVSQWEALGGSFTKDGRFLIMKNSPAVTTALQDAAKGLGYKHHVASTFSKESLYGEDAQEIMFMLREKYNVLASEMEQLLNAFIAAYSKAKYEANILTGMVVAVIGAVPGPGFPDKNNKKEMAKQEETEVRAVKIAADALVRLSWDLERQ
ncbi:nucleoside phosphorylase [Candidatus Parvarchaeota archaeon]|nr:nucleoside phosphorylase [Candidatus Parvarchaeota archaeon]